MNWASLYAIKPNGLAAPRVLLKNGDPQRPYSKARCVELVEDDDQVLIFP